jgi:hypothetical protein
MESSHAACSIAHIECTLIAAGLVKLGSRIEASGGKRHREVLDLGRAAMIRDVELSNIKWSIIEMMR